MLRVALSLLDRLLYPVGSSGTEGSPETFKAGLRRDLEYLLNTVKPTRPDLAEWPRLRQSLLDFGLPEFVGIDPADPDAQTRVAVAIEHVIRVFEPRLANVSVSPMFPIDGNQPTSAANPLQLSFRVRADLILRPLRERLYFRAVLENGTLSLRPQEFSGDA